MITAASQTLSLRQADGDVRSAIHHAVAGVMLSIYGYHVCNFINGLAVATWVFSLVPILIAQWVVRTLLAHRIVSHSSTAFRPRNALLAEVAVFAVGGTLLGALNVVAWGFPPGSGMKMTLGFTCAGLFAGADAALARMMARFEQGGLDAAAFGKRAPFALRFGLATALVMSSLVAICALLVLRAFEDGAHGQPTNFARVAVELLFVLCVFMAYTFNLVRGLGRLIGSVLNEQISTLRASHGSVAHRRAVVASADELGTITHEINTLLDALEESDRNAARANETTIRGLVALAGARDNETGLHLRRTQIYVELIARQLAVEPDWANLPDEESIQLLRAAAPLHDIGKVGIPDRVLLKPGRLTDDEFALMQTHVALGLGVLDGIEEEVGVTPFLQTVRHVIAGHHERWDGKGYPAGLAGEDIPLAGRIMAVADVYDALRSSRVYKPSMSREDARRIIVEGAGAHFDARIVSAFLLVEPEIARTAERLSDNQDAARPVQDSRSRSGLDGLRPALVASHV